MVGIMERNVAHRTVIAPWELFHTVVIAARHIFPEVGSTALLEVFALTVC